jgi:geranylgeranyl reductase family protein
MDPPSVPQAQPDVDQAGRRRWDAIVIGAGPAGSVAAGELASAGLQTLLLERDRFPRRKTCGDGLNLDALQELERIGLADSVRRAGRCVDSVCVVSAGGDEIRVEGPFVTLERRWLDQALAAWAVDRGAVFARGEVAEIGLEDAPHRYRVQAAGARPVELRAPAVIVATGADTRLAEHAGLVAPRRPSAAAARLYVRARGQLDELLAVYDDSALPGYGWIFPMPDGLFNVGVITFYRRGRLPGPALARRLESFCRDYPLLRGLMREGEVVVPRKSAPLRCGLPDPKAAGRGGLLAAGEVVGTTYPLTGEGVGKAMQTGSMAARSVREAVGEGWPARAAASYVDRLERLTPRYALYGVGERWLGWAWANRWIASRALRSDRARRALQEVIVQERGLREALATLTPRSAMRARDDGRPGTRAG